MAGPILWAPGIFWFFLLEKPHAHKIPPFRDGGFWIFLEGGGGGANFIFMGAVIFLIKNDFFGRFEPLLSEGPKGGRRKGGRGRKWSHFSFCYAFRCCVVYSPCFPVWGEEKVMTIYDAGPLAAGPLCGLLILSTLKMTGRRFHRTAEGIPRRPWNSKSPLGSKPVKKKHA